MSGCFMNPDSHPEIATAELLICIRRAKSCAMREQPDTNTSILRSRLLLCEGSRF